MASRSRKRKHDGAMHIHQDVNIATTYEPSADGRRINARSSVLEMATAPYPSNYWGEDFETAQALELPEFSYLCGDDGWDEQVDGRFRLAGEEDEAGPDDGITVRLGELSGKTVHLERWADADTPMKVFVKFHREETLDEMNRGEGRGSSEVYSHCAQCKEDDPLFRCARQTCIGAAMYCEACIAQLHQRLPTHTLEKWTGDFFVPMTLSELDVETRIQLGHPPGEFCSRARPAHKDFVIIDTLGIRIVKLNFCGCDSTVEHRQQLMRACLWPATSIDPQTCATFNAVRLFEAQNCLGKISAYDFVRSLELLSNNDGLETVDKEGAPKPPPVSPISVQSIGILTVMAQDRRRAFRAIVRQYRMMEMLKRAGRGQDDSGVAGTGQGELALPCRACPHPEINLPDGWDKINWDEMDEDQRQARDPIVDDGAGYFCNRAEYSEYIRQHVDEDEISSCSGFQAMFLACAKRIKGLRVTGVGGFSKHIWKRMANLPAKYHLKIDIENIRWMVPNFHLPPHKKGCHSPFSFHFLWGAARTHGETVEQNWEFLNGIAASTKMMGLGARATALEGLFAFHNWRRQIAHRRLLKQRLAEGITDGKKHKEAFQAFTEGLSSLQEVDVESWRVWVDKWEKARHLENEKGSPYEFEDEGLTLKEIRLLLAAEEYGQTGDGDEVEREDTPSTFLTMGMELEEAQRQVAVAIKAAGPNPTPTQELDFLKRRTTLRVRLQAFRKLQGTYMPKLRRYLNPGQKAVWDADDQQPEATRLFMPSDIETAASRVKACATGLPDVEARLRKGEASEALAQLRRGLRTRSMTNRFKIRNWSGQRALTRGQGILRQVNIKIHAAKLRYRFSRNALLKLLKHGDWENTFRVLEESDVRALNDRALREEEQAYDEHLGALGVSSGFAATGAVAAGETHRTLSWIWYAVSMSGDGDAKFHEALRVEWCKAYSRASRWHEEVVLRLVSSRSRTNNDEQAEYC
ncbi:hypothetical protein C8R47DRAFT_1070284 [Mycena vitilis]|nr:hypothetical protein C8R47DRAFT_1070284 [Mycena vitilis]